MGHQVHHNQDTGLGRGGDPLLHLQIDQGLVQAHALLFSQVDRLGGAVIGQSLQTAADNQRSAEWAQAGEGPSFTGANSSATELAGPHDHVVGMTASIVDEGVDQVERIGAGGGQHNGGVHRQGEGLTQAIARLLLKRVQDRIGAASGLPLIQSMLRPF